MSKYFLQQRIRFESIDDFTGQEIEREGTIVGYSEDVRRRWPEEMALAVDMLLVKVEMPQRDVFHAVAENEVLEILKESHDDECDCVTCRARVEKGGLDYDPSNDDEEFEEHERQVFRDTGIDKEEK
jgi:ferredoxin